MNKHGSMNRFYRLVWSDARTAWVPVAEIASGRRKRGGRARVAVAMLLATLGISAAYADGPPSTATLGIAPPVHELPTGGNVVAGNATINTTSTADTAILNIDQSSQRAVIDWNTFNVGSAAEVNFNQPNANAATLNRVLDSNASQIFGKINATGQVFLINPNGVYFGKSAQVDVGALTATTGSISNDDFMSGNLHFSKGGNGAVVNEGELRAAVGGYIAMLAPEVRNSGVIVARLGTVALAAGDAFTLNFDNNHLTGITIQPATMKALVENKGAVIAPGGLIVMSAQAFDKLQGGVVNNSGSVEATGMAMKNGRIVLEASSSVINSGTISANAGADGSPAGSVTINAPTIENTGRIEASAVTNTVVTGGSIELNADMITQSAGGVLDVSGFTGGHVELNATQDITLAGVVTAAATTNAAALVDANNHGGDISITAAHNVTLQDAVVDASGDAAGGQIIVQSGHQDPSAPAGNPNTLALLGETQLRTSSRRGKGGSVALSSDRVGLFDSSSIDASGATGGGDVKVGGGFHGEDASIVNARAAYVGADVIIKADATAQGDGGKVVVWSDDSSRFLGEISARGGERGGDGGFVEVSSKGVLDFRGDVKTQAPQGHVGTLLLDPYNLTISNGSNTNVSGATPFDATGTGSILNVSTLQDALANSDVTVTTGSSGGETGNLTVANTVGWFTDYSLTLSAAGTITVNNGVSVIAAGNGNITFTTTNGDIINNGAVRTYGGNFTATTLAGAGGAIWGSGSYNIVGTASFTTAGNIGLSNVANKFGSDVSLLAGGSVTLVNSQATVLKGATGDANGISITSGGSITTGISPSGITTAGALTMTTNSGTNGSISYTGAVSASGNITFSADGNGAISLADINGAATFVSVVAGGAVTIGDNNTGSLTFDSASGNVFSGTAGSSGQASGAVTIKGSSITINDPFVTKGGNLNLISTSGAVTANSGANITTTANTDTGTASGTVTVTAANGITLQNIVTTGADNSLGVGSNAAAVTLTATTGNVNVGAITTSGGSATTGATSNRNGGNAGNIVITSSTGTTYLNGDLNAIGGGYVGTATQGLGGYIDMESAVVLTANRVVSSGATSGDILFKSTVDSDGTARSLSVTAGIGSVIFNKAVGGSAALSSLTVASSTQTSARGNITTNAAGGVAITGTTIRLGDDTVTNGTGNITVDTSTGNGTVTLSSINTYLDDAVTFTRGTGLINFTNYLYSNTSERNNLTFNGASGGAITVGIDVGGTGAGANTALGDILVSTGTDLTFSRGIVAKSLVALNSTGRLSLGASGWGSYFDGASGFQIATTGTKNNYAGDENISILNSVTLTNNSAPLSITAPGTISSAYAYNTLTTAGGNLTLTAGGSLTLPSNGSLGSSGGTITLTGVGVTQAQDDTVNAGSGKIRVDGGNAAVSLNGTLITTNADTGSSPAVLITRASTVSLRSVTAQTGTLQVGLVGSTNSLATSQSLGSSGSLTLTGNTSYYSPRRITVTGTGNNSSVSYTITGTDASGNAASQTISGANNGTATTTQYFATVTSITTNAATVGSVTAGVATEATSGSLTQYLPGGYTNAIDIHTLSAASSAAISLTSTSNTIDQLSSFSVGSNLDVEAKGRSAGMQLTGNVAATDVVIKTGNGALVLGDYNITSTSGNVWLQGTGVTQTSNSTITSAGTTQIYGNDYQNGTRGNVTLAGSIVSSSHVYLYSTLNLTLPNITVGSAGSRGYLVIGDNSNNCSPCNTYNGIYGNISQSAGTAIKIGTLQGFQVAGYGTTDLTNANNEIQYLGYFYRGGTFSVNDADVEANGLTSTSSISDGTNNTAIRIKTSGAYNLNGQQLYGQGLTINASSISGSGNLYGHSGSGGSIILIANGGNITLSGDTYTNGTGADLVIRSSNNLQLGSRTHIGNSNLTLGANATTGTLSASQTVSGAGNLTINGTSASGGSVAFTAGQRISVTSAGNDSGITYTVTGTDMFGKAQTEVITGANAGAASGAKYFNTVTQIAASSAAAGTVSVGTAVETIAGNVTQTGYIESAPTLQGNVIGSITLSNGSNSFQNIGTLTSGGNMTLYSAVNPLTVTGATTSTGGNVAITSGYALTVNSSGSVNANGSGKSVTLTSGNAYATTIQGALSADTGGITVNSGGTFTNNATGTITTTGGVSIKTYWDGLNARNLTLGGNITAGANGIKLNSSGTITQSAGALSTTGAVSGPDSSGGGAPGVSNPSARGAVTLNGNNTVASLGPFYVYNTSGSAFSFNDTTGGLTLAGSIATSNGNITITTAGGALNLATYGVYAGELASGGANVALTGQGITQASGTISATGSSDGTTPRNGSSGGTITLTGYDGVSSGAISLGGTIQTANNTTSAVTIRGTAALALPNISAPNGSLNVGDTSQSYYHITGAITQTAATSLDIKTLNVAGDSSAVLANTGNKIVQLGNIAVGDNAGVNYDFDVYNSINGLSLTQSVVSAGGVRIITAQGAGSSGALAIGSNNVYAIGNIYLGALGITQGAASTINANNGGSAGSGGDITIDGGGSTNNITLAGTVRTDGSGKSLSVINATNATLNVISATAGNVVLGTSGSPLTGSIALVPTTGVVSANTLLGYAGIVNLGVSNIDNVGAFTSTGALTLIDSGGAGSAGLKLTGNVTVGAASSIESTDGVLDLDTRTIDASGGTGYDLVLKGVGVSQTTGSMIKSTTATITGGSGNINLFSVLNDFTGQVTVNSTGSQVSIQDANQLSMNSLTGKLANTTSFTAWAGTNLVLTPESITTTTGSIDFRSLNGNLSTPGNITTGAGSVTLIAGGTGSNGNVQVNNTITTGSGNVTVQASKQANLSNSITSTSGNISVTGDTVIHSTGSPGSPLTLQTAGAGTITVSAAGTGGFVMGQYYSYQSGSGAISITSGATADLANITSTSGNVTVNAVGAVQQLAGSSIVGNALTVAATNNGAITLANANNNAAYISLRSLNLAGNAAGTGNITYNDLNAVAVRRIQTTGNATLTAGGAITTDTGTGPGTVVANALSVKTLNDSAADISLVAAGNDVSSITLKVRNAADTADVGVANTTGNIDYTDANGFTITAIQSGGSAELIAGGAVAQTGAILLSGLGLSGTGSFTLNNASSGVPINQVATFASNASGAVNFSSNRALTIGTVIAAGPITGITSNGGSVTISATSIDSSAGPIDTRSSTPATAGGAVTLTTTGTTSSGNLTVGDINTSGSDAGVSTNGNGGAAGAITLTTTGNTLSVSGAITARGGAGDGSGTTGADGLVALTANAGAVTQTNGSGTHAIDAGKLLVSALNASSFLDTGNSTDFVAAKITGAGQGFTYRSAGNYTVGAGNGTITGLSTQGGAIDLGSSNVAITDVETITTKGGNFSANNIGGFDSTGVTLSTAGDITYAAGAYKNGGAVSITTTSGNITTGPIVTSGDSSASAATGGSVTLNANGVLTTGSITSLGAGTSAGGAVNLTGSTVRLGGQVSSGGGTGGASQAAGGNITVTGPAVLYGGDLVLDSGSGAGNVTFTSTIDSDNIGSIRSLTINAGTGDINLQGALGGNVTLKNVALNSSGTTTMGGAVTASSLTTDAMGTTHINGASVNTTGNQIYNDDVILGANTTLTSGGNVNFAGTVKSDGTNRALTVHGSGTTTFTGAVGGSGSVAGDKLASLVSDAGGTTAINGGSVITTGTQTYGDNITLGADTTLTGSTITTQGTVTGNTRTFTITGNAVFGNDIGDTVTGVATLAVSGTTAINTNTITSTGAQTYTGGVTLGADVTLTGVGVNLANTVKSDGTNRALTVNDSGTTTFGGAVGGDGSVAGDKLASLATNSGGTTAINGGSIITTGAQVYGDNVTLGADASLTGSMITTQGTVTGNSHSLGITGNAVVGNDTSDSITGVTTLAVNGTSAINANTITSSGAQTYSGAVTLDTDVTLTGVGVNLASTVKSDGTNRALTVNDSGTTTFGGAVGGDGSVAGDKLASLATNSGGTTAINGGSIITTGTQVYGDNVTLGADATLIGNTITTQGTVTGNTHALGITGNAVLGNDSSDSITGVTALAVSGTTAVNTNTITSSDTQTYTGAVTLDTNATFTGAGVNFVSTVKSDGTNRALIINDSGTTTFGDAVGGDGSVAGDKLASLATNSGGATAINGGSVITTGTQTYGDNVTLGADATLTGSTITTQGTVTGNTHALGITGNAVLGNGSSDSVTGVTTLAVSGTTAINTDTITSSSTQTYTGGVTLGADATLTGAGINFASTVKSDGTNRALTVNDSGTTTFGGAVGGDGSVAGDKLASLATNSGGTTAINGGSVITTGAQTYGDNVTLGANTSLTGSTITTRGTIVGNTHSLGFTGNVVVGDDSSDSITGVTTLASSGTTAINTDTITSSSTQTYTGDVTLGADVTLTGVGVNLASTVKSDGTNRALTVNDSGTTTFGGAVGGDGSVAGDKLASLATNSGGTTAVNGGSVITTGTQIYGDNVTLGANSTLTGSTITTQGTVIGNTHALGITGNAVFGNDSSDSITGLTTLGVSGATAINTGTITSSGAQTYTGAVTLGTDATLTGSAINFGSTVDGDVDNTRSLNLVSTGGTGQNFVAAVGGTHALDTLRIESVGVVTQGAPIHATQLAIKSAGNVTLTNASNAVDVLAALLSGNASLSFVDSSGVEIGTIGSGGLQIIGISDGSGTSTVSITLGGALTQAASSPIHLHGDLAIDTSAYNAGDVTVDNTGASGTVLGNSLIAGDFTLASTGNVTQASGAHLQVGGNFDVNGGGSFIEGNSPDNLIGGGSASVSGNQIRLYGVITLTMDSGTGDLLASAFNGTSTTTASIVSANLGAGVQVVSASGGKSISLVNSGAAVTLGETNSIGGSLSITTQGTYSNGGTATATGIKQGSALNLDAASFTVQQSAANAGSVIAGAGKLDLSDTSNAFAGTVSMTAVGMDAKLAANTNIDLGTVNVQNVTVATTQNITQAASRAVQANTLLLRNAQNVTLNNANLVNTLAASGITGAMSFNNAQALSVGTASTVDGINSSGSVLLKTTAGDLVLDKGITVSGSSNITLVAAANFTNNLGASALTLGTGHWQVWSTDPSLDTLNGLAPNFKQYNATYGSSTVLGSGNGVLYTLAPQLTLSLTGTVVRTYDADVDATLTQGNYNISGTVGSDAVVLGTSGTFDNKNVGSGKTITVNPVVVSASDGAVQVYGYRIDSGSATISGAIGQITPATISAVTGIAAANKTYNGNTVATLDTTTSVGFTGKFIGDQLNVASATGTFASPNASATPITVNITGISLGGSDAGNYTLSSSTASTTALINKYAVDLSGTRVYDGTTTVGAGSLTLGTLVGSETLNLSGNATAASKNVGTQTLNSSGLTLSDGTGLASNYTFTGGTQTVAITKANLTLSTSDVTKTYDGSLSALGTAVIAGGTQLFSGDSLSGGSFAFTNANAGTGNKTVTTTGVTVNDGNSGGNYTVTYANNTTSTINKAAITVSTSNVTKTYDGTLTAAGTAVVTSGTLYHNVSNSNALDNLSGGTFGFTDANAGTGNKTVTTTGVTVNDGNSGGNYVVTYANNATSTINKANLTISTSNVTKTYDGSLNAAGTAVVTAGTLYHNASNSNALDNLSGGTFAFTNANAGTGNKTVTTTGVTVSDGNSGGNYNVTYANNTASTINKAAITVSTSDVTKSYDGTLAALGTAVVTSGTLYNNASNSNALDNLSGGTFAFTNANAGTSNKTITTTGVTVNDGNSGGNYTVTYANNTTSTINKANITVSTSNVTKTYDGTLNAAGTAVVTAGTLYHNASNSNALDNLSGGTFAYTDKNAGSGNKSVAVSGVAVNDGNSGGNYNVTYANNLTSTINPYAVSLTGTRVYDGTTTVGAGTLTLGTLVGSETLTLSGSGTAASKNVGLETVSISGLTLGDGSNGGLAGNYTFTGGTQTVNITKANISITSSDVTKTYNGTMAAVGAAMATNGTQLFGTDTLSGGAYAFTNANAGTGNKTVTTTGVTLNDGNSGGNYTVTYVNNTTSTINKADITVSTSNVTKTYDGTLTAAGAAVVTSGTLYHNASNGNALDNLIGGSFAFADKNAGSGNKSVTASGVTVVDGNSGGNYNVSYADNTTSTINRATVTFTGTIADKEYDGSTTATLSGYVLMGLIGGETLNAGATTANFVDKNAAVGKTVNVGGISLADGGNGGLAGNYLVASTATSTATITPKLLTINAVVSDKVYDGTVNASLQSYGLSGFVGSETVSGVFTGSASFADKNVGINKAVTITGITLVNGVNGGLATNYAVTTNANSNANISKANLNIAGVVAENKVYDGTLIANLNTTAAQITGKFGSDDVSVGSITGTYLTKDVGVNKTIGAGTVILSGVDAGNYNLIQPTSLSSSITARALTVTAVGDNKVYDGTMAAMVNLNDNRISGDVLNVSSSNAFADKNAGNGKFIDVSNIAISGTDAHNYTVNSTAATMANITKANLTVTVVGVDKVYDATTAATVTLSSQAIGSDVVNVGYTNATFNNKNVGQGKQVSVNGVSISGADAANYAINGGVATTANITPATLTVNAVGNNKTYDGKTDATVVFTDNRFTGDQVSMADTAANFDTPEVGAGKAISVTGIHVTGGADAGNYVLANTSTDTTGSIIGSVTSVATESASLPPMPAIPPINVTVPSAPAPVVDLTLPAGFGRAPGGSNSNGTGTGGTSTGTNTTGGTSGNSTVGSTAGNSSTGGSNSNSAGSNTSTSTSGTGASNAAAGTSNTSGTTGVAVNGVTSAVVNANASAGTGAGSNVGSTGPSTSGSSPATGDASGTADGNGKGAGGVVAVTVDQPASDKQPGVVSVKIPADSLASGKSVSFALPDAVIEAIGNNEARVTRKNGKRLPAWLQYVPASKSFTIATMPAGALPIEVSVRAGSQQWIVVISASATN